MSEIGGEEFGEFSHGPTACDKTARIVGDGCILTAFAGGARLKGCEDAVVDGAEPGALGLAAGALWAADYPGFYHVWLQPIPAPAQPEPEPLQFQPATP